MRNLSNLTRSCDGRRDGMKPKASDCARLAIQLADGPKIPYILGGESKAGLDCQGLIEHVVRSLGGSLAYRGSNDMYRNACAELRPLSEAERSGRMVPGCVLFIVRQDGGEPALYKADGKGNASHVGWYTGEPETVHASASAGRVTKGTLKGGWTHCGWLKEVEYGGETEAVASMDRVMRVSAPNGGSVRLRRHPANNAVVLVNVPSGERLEALGEKALRSGVLWTPVRYDVYTGYMMSAYLKEAAEASQPDSLEVRVAALEEWRARMEGGAAV